MRITVPNVPLSIPILEAFLEGLTEANRVFIEAGEVPASPLDAKVRYQREERGLEDWCHAVEVLRRGFGDCEDLNSWLAGGYRATGNDPYARTKVLQAGKGKFHAVCELSDGTVIDACPPLGMGTPGELGFKLPRIRIPFLSRAKKRGGRAGAGDEPRDARAAPEPWSAQAEEEAAPEPVPAPAQYPDPYGYPYDPRMPGYPYNQYPQQAYGYPPQTYIPVPNSWPAPADYEPEDAEDWGQW